MDTPFSDEYQLSPQETLREAPLPVLDVEEQAARDAWISILRQAQMVRDSAHSELDDMDYLTAYRTNQAADNAYLPPKMNPQDLRVVTGLTHEKGNTLLSALLNYNFEGQFIPFDDENMPNYELGDIMGSLVKKSREMEDWQRKRPYVYRELLAQGTVNVLETWFEERVRVKQAASGWSVKDAPTKFKLAKDKVETLPGRGEATLLSGTMVYYGNIREPNIAKQPFVYTVEIIPYEVAKTIYGGYERWKNVPRRAVYTLDGMGSQIKFRDWTLLTSPFNYVEVIRGMDKPNNCYQLFLNGVPMLPVNYPLTEVSPSGEYPVSKGDVEVMAFFAYAKSIPAKTKVEQAVIDEMMKLAVLKTQQSYLPIWANNTGKQIRRSMLIPAGVINDIDPDKLKPLFNQPGVTQSEMAFMSYLKEVIDSKSINSVFGGDETNGKMTATQALEMKKAQIMKLGQIVWGVVQLEQQMHWLRNWNHLAHLTKPQMEYYDANKQKVVQKYRSFMVNDKLDDGREGLKLIDFNRPEGVTDNQIMLEEQLYTERFQKPVRVYYVDPEAMREMKFTWHCAVTPTEEQTSELEGALFFDHLAKAVALFGPQAINWSNAKKRAAIHMKEDPDEFFVPDQAQQMQPMAAPGAPGQQTPTSQLMNAVNAPSVNDMMQMA